jgi:hypothetical protein
VHEIGKPYLAIVIESCLMAAGSMAEAKAKGRVRIVGKDYVMADGDVVEFRFNVWSGPGILWRAKFDAACDGCLPVLMPKAPRQTLTAAF